MLLQLGKMALRVSPFLAHPPAAACSTPGAPSPPLEEHQGKNVQKEAVQVQDFMCLASLVSVFYIFPTPSHFFSLSVFSLYCDPPFLLLLLCRLIPLPALSPSPAICFPPSIPWELRGVSALWHREAPRMHRWCSGFPSLYFPEKLLAFSHGWEQMVFLQTPPGGCFPCRHKHVAWEQLPWNFQKHVKEKRGDFS